MNSAVDVLPAWKQSLINNENALIEQLRKENMEQFYTLVRMHLSFVVDINTDDSVDGSSDKPKPFRWGFAKKSKNTPTSTPATVSVKAHSDTSLTEEGISKIYELIDFLVKEENVKQEGIFRRTGSLSRQQELKQLIMSASPLSLDEGRFSVHDCASVLKGFLAELPQPLLTDQHYSTYCTLAAQHPTTADTCESRLLTALQLLLLLLPPLHRDLLSRLLSLLQLTAAHEDSNRMSPDTLATMFTPHLLCPRQLSPEALHADAVSLAPLVSCMIRRGDSVLRVPAPLATDVAAYFTMRARRRALSPSGELDDSISDRTAASTIYTFVDRQRTSVENSSNPTDTALAQLYAHIQALPDSQHKRRLVKQFNRHNGSGTPIQIQRTGKIAGSKSLGESIKKHIFHKGILNKTPKKSNSDCIPEKESPFKDKIKLTTEDAQLSEVSHKGIVLKNLAQKIANSECDDAEYNSDGSEESTKSEGSLLDRVNKLSPKFVSEPNLSILDDDNDEETPKNTRTRGRLFRSKAAAASQKKFKQKANTHKSTPTSCVPCISEMDSEVDLEIDEASDTTPVYRLSRRDNPKKCDFETFSPKSESSEEIARGSVDYLTSTPSVALHAACDRMTTPHVTNYRRSSMSPITKSTQKLPKAMQESIMTPRSRKPLIMTEQRDASLVIDTQKKESTQFEDIYCSPKNDSDFVSSDESNRSETSGRNTKNNTNDSTSHSSQLPSTSTTSDFLDNNKESDYAHEFRSKSLTEPFREYLLSRSVLTANPVDLSFGNKSQNIEEIIDGKISDSLMFCLDGNEPSGLEVSRTDKHESGSNVRSPLKNINNYSGTDATDKTPRKRNAVDDSGGKDDSLERKKSPRDLNKENVDGETNTSLWETDL